VREAHPTIRLDIDELLGPPDQRRPGDPANDWDDETRQFRLHYQPVINTGNGRMVAVKALLRWEHPLFGTLTPRRFVPLVLNAGRMLDIGEAVLRRAAIDLRRWQAAGCDGVRIDIELIQSQFYDPQLPHKLGAVLAHYDLAPESICLQVSEAILRQNATANLAILEQIAHSGVGLALTNFGAGAFAVGALQPFPFNRVNIGAAFVQDMVTIADDAAMAEQIFGALHAFGMRIGADGVETANEYALLRQFRCDEVQGPFFFRAMPAEGILALLRQGAALAEAALLPHSTRSLLLVDEDANIVAELKRLLRPDHYSIATASSGAQALELLELHRFDVILCAQRMSGMSGADFFAAARPVCPDSARLLLAGSPDVPAVIDAVNAGTVDKFLCKPWNDAQLRFHVAQAFRHKELGDENRRLNLEVHTAAQRLAQVRQELEALQRHVLAREGIAAL
jgi:EAL domain-containing protein (putative c-di-GMP-specific phosphodiesterase class I)/FixJ family two-component response regulator